jgi:Putative zinc-finger
VRVNCEQVRELLPEYVDAGPRPAGTVEEHLAACVICSGLLQTYRGLLSSLAELRTVDIEPPAGFLDRTLRTVRLGSYTSRIPRLADIRRVPGRAVETLVRAPRAGFALASLGGAAVGATAIALVWWRMAKRGAVAA